jgi:hypothetical protein
MINQVLSRALRPDLYRVNAFRLAQLPAQASQRDITRRLDKLTMQAKLGTAHEPGRGPLALMPPPGLDLVREAVERLRDPEVRLLDEFFWFWPLRRASDTPEDALADLERGDVASARRRWQETLPHPVALHNLAVLAHLMALDIECRSLEAGRSPDSFLCRMRDQAWADAWKSWKDLSDNAAFWDCFRDRIRELNEPQLPESLTEDYRRDLPAVLLGINATLAIRWSERRLPPEVERHKLLLQNSGFDAAEQTDALRQALRPIRERIKTLCASSTDTGTPTNWQTAIDLFRSVADLPSSGVDRDNLLEDAGPALYHICWFCQKQASDPGSATPVILSGRVTRTRTGSGESLHWDRHLIEVPRCWQCLQAHQHWDMNVALGLVACGTRPESEKTAFPFVAKYLADGWNLGAAPEKL